MSDSIFKLQLLARSELALTRIYARRAASRSAYLGAALVLLLLALGMADLSAYLALQQHMSPATSALLVALANIVLAAATLQLGGRSGPSQSEEKMAREIREMAYREVSKDVDEVKERLDNLSGEVSRIGDSMSKVAGSAKFILGLLGK